VPACHLCSFDELSVLPSYEALHRVTSDCKPWPPGGQLGVCPRCGGAQAVISPRWEAEAHQIYDRYTIYHQSGGVEQSVFDAATGAAQSRSSRLLHRLKEELPFSPEGRLLDIGCGNGTTLRAFNEIAPGWSLAGLDVNDHYQKAVESIPGVEALYTGAITAVPGQFQIITLIHSLEHIAEPAKFLAGLWDKLVGGGVLVVQVPDCWRNPFMFLVADHATHFFAATLHDVVVAGGYDVVVTADDWIAKELTLIARKPAHELPPQSKANAVDNVATVRDRVEWVVMLGQQTRALAAKNSLGLFGTSIAATWLQEEMHGEAAFFVDEDPSRFGQVFMGRPILRPSEVPPGGQVMIALPTPMAEQVRTRLLREAPDVKWLVPPALPK
jgi:2-polyprenyl-3-methyl-5-hydroxy-6-metoxy-1,4-benzoquinol methylase